MSESGLCVACEAGGVAGAPPAAPQPYPYAQPAPPAHAAPPYAPAPRLPAHLASPEGLARAAVVLLGVCALTDVLSLFAGYTMLGVANRMVDNPGFVTQDEVDRADLLEAGSGLVQTLALLASAVVFVIWFRRVRINAEVFRPDGHRMRRGWAVWAWITPAVCLWFPKKMANDVWAASLPYGPDGSPRRAPRTVMNWWWGLWIATLVLGRASGRMYIRAESPEEIRQAVVALMVSDVLDIVAAVVAVLFVRRLTALQHEKAHQGPVAPYQAPVFR
ncbi:DUF4328 domain-containing protein [Streptomyces luteireticuli]|uniref:DUF4328 domain-containing protein n=1 Tax=Streptomyces luteireticuli TaxID=173858 RepID=UPI003558A7CE